MVLIVLVKGHLICGLYCYSPISSFLNRSTSNSTHFSYNIIFADSALCHQFQSTINCMILLHANLKKKYIYIYMP